MAVMVQKMVVGPLEENCYIVSDEERSGTKCFLVDPGAAGNRILAQLKMQGKVPEAIFLTHGHFDHIMAVEWIRKEYPEIPVYALDKEREVLEDPEKSLLRALGGKFDTEHVIFAEDGSVLSAAGVEMKCIATPGHTAGSVSYYIGSDHILFSGDTLFLEGAGRTDLPTGSTMAIADSIRNRLMPLPEETVVYPGHGPETTVGHEKKYNYMVNIDEKNL